MVHAHRTPLRQRGRHAVGLYWFETLAIMSFGFSWLVKGGAILADRPSATAVQPTEPAVLAARG